jgi:predicted methyltransferase
MVRKLAIGMALALALASSGVQAKKHHSPPVRGASLAAAVASPTRSADNLKLDGSRKPAEVLAFLGLKPGMQVADMFGVNHYWAEIFATAVGPKGRVVVWEPTQFYSEKSKSDFATFAAGKANVSIIDSAFATPNLPAKKFDFMLLNLDYHDVYWQSEKYGIARMEPDVWLKSLYAAMKPGGIVGVVDHIGPAGDTRAIVEKEHRIDPVTVRADFERAGFVFTGESDLLRNPADDHSLLVFDPAIRGKTDRFIYRFKKPR